VIGVVLYHQDRPLGTGQNGPLLMKLSRSARGGYQRWNVPRRICNVHLQKPSLGG
jgi:hypothetical protein